MKGRLAFVLLGLLLGGLVGSSIGYVLGQTGRTVAASAATNTELPDDTQTQKEQAPLEQPNQPNGVPTPRSLDDIIASADIPPVPSGGGAFHGSVTTIDGEPLEGIEVSCSSSYPSDHLRRSELSTTERVQREIRRAKWEEAAKHISVSDAEGEWRIEGLDEDTSYWVAAESPGWKIENKNTHMGWPKPDAEIHFVARPETQLEVQVEDQEGGAPKYAKIYYRSKVASEREAYFRADYGPETLRLTPGTWSIYATSDADRSETIEVVVEAGKGIEPLTLILKPTPGIEGNLSVPEGFRLPTLSVYLQANPDGTIDPGKQLGDVNHLTHCWLHEDDGQLVYRFVNLSNGIYRVYLTLDHEILDWGNVVVEDNIARLDLTCSPPDTTRYFRLRVTGPDGSVLRDLDFGLTTHSSAGTRSSGAKPLMQDDGTFWFLRALEREEAGDLWYEIEIRSPKYGNQTVRFESADTAVKEARLVPPANLELTILGWADSPARKAVSWRLVPRGDSSFFSRELYGDPAARKTGDEKKSFGPVEPGDYDVVLSLGLAHWRSADLLREPVTLKSGDNSFSVTMPELYSLTIASGDSRVSVHSKDETISIDASDLDIKDGTTTIPYLPAGSYTLKDRSGEMTVSVSGPTTVEFKPKLYNCFVLALRATRGRIAALGLQDGDKLIEIDGVTLDKGDEDYPVVQGAMSKESTTWVVLRNGARTQVTFSGKELYAVMTDPDPDKREWLGMERGMSE
ncbi:MAG: hypothetical protein KDB82_15475 [Planctomycetes bacterium]|nr:hypothetical protein [Planctomycetota bacterium]